jgi:hypothetical protein
VSSTRASGVPFVTCAPGSVNTATTAPDTSDRMDAVFSAARDPEIAGPLLSVETAITLIASGPTVTGAGPAVADASEVTFPHAAADRMAMAISAVLRLANMLAFLV